MFACSKDPTVVVLIATPTPILTEVPEMTFSPNSYPKTSPTAIPTAIPTNSSNLKHVVKWSSTKNNDWVPDSIPPECNDFSEIFNEFPVDINIVTEYGRPGKPGSNNTMYLAHGYIRSHTTPYDQITVRFPGNGFSLYAANMRTENYSILEKNGDIRQIDDSIKQVKLEFQHPCGIKVMFDHLVDLSPKWDSIVEKVPILMNDSRVTFFPIGEHFVESGEILSYSIGHPDNIYLDFGVYDLREKNNISTKIDSKWPEYSITGNYGLCWESLFNTETKSILKSLPGGIDDNSDYCN